MRVVFFGTPYYVLPILEALHKEFRERGESPIEAVVTQSPKPTGRKQIVEYSPVDDWAHKKNIPIFFDSAKLISEGIRADIGVLASYGAMIPDEVINYFPKGILVVHPSILPEFRWSSPVQAMILTHSKNVGCSIIKMDAKWDHGPIVTQFRDEIQPSDNYQTLRDRLFTRSAEVLIQAIPAYLSGRINLKKQDEDKASFARRFKKEEAFIDPKALAAVLNAKKISKEWEIPFIKLADGSSYTHTYTPETVYDFIRAMSPTPGAWTHVRLEKTIDVEPQRLKILKAHLNESGKMLEIDEVQLEGKNPVGWNLFKQGYPDSSF